ncbi:hypothetical protein ACQP1W_31465 [Spirillospora sp. CA-255316]
MAAISDSKNLREAAATISRNLSMDGDLFPDDVRRTKAFFMIGLLEVSIGGTPMYFASSSGWRDGQDGIGWLATKHLKDVKYQQGKWNIQHPDLPAAAKDWRTVIGHDAHMPQAVHDPIRKCAAMRLLRQVTLSNPDKKPVSGLAMCEMVHIGKDAQVTDPVLQRRARVWHGKMGDSSWTAHSCDGCSASIPFLICSLAPNEFIPPDQR